MNYRAYKKFKNAASDLCITICSMEFFVDVYTLEEELLSRVSKEAFKHSEMPSW